MACNHPLKGFPVGMTEAGKTKYKICSFDVDHVEVMRNGSVVPCNGVFSSDNAVRVIRDFVLVPCGRCLGCRLDYSRQWADRCLAELAYHDSAYFVTLTYDEEHLPWSKYPALKDGSMPDESTGEVSEEQLDWFTSMTLCKRDVQLFMKRLRKAYPDDKIRYFGCGEYGPKTFRPHYHLILFGLHLDDLYVDAKSPLGYDYYKSPKLEKVWSFPRRGYDMVSRGESCNAGFVTVANVSWDTCAYTARYMTKKLLGDDGQFYDTFHITPPFSLCSRRPGLGRQYYDDHKEEIKGNVYTMVSTEEGGHKLYPPKYFRKLLEVDDPEWSEENKLMRRQQAIMAQQAKLSLTSLGEEEYNDLVENSLVRRTKSLERKVF